MNNPLRKPVTDAACGIVLRSANPDDRAGKLLRDQRLLVEWLLVD
jgi:hypothetical protein